MTPRFGPVLILLPPDRHRAAISARQVPDEKTPDGLGADYVPVIDGHLNGAKSLQANYRYLKQRSSEVAGDAPVVVFIDWPNEMMTRYLALPLQEKKDYWQIFGAEAYANGIYPAFHLRNTVGDPDGGAAGHPGLLPDVLPLLQGPPTPCRNNGCAPEAVRVKASNVSASLLAQRGSQARALHLVNHNYHRGMVPHTGLHVEVDLASRPRRVTMVSPDFAGAKTPASSFSQGKLRLTIDRLDYDDVLVIE